MNKRLKELALMVDKEKIVCDVGTDHAFLPIYLVLNKISDRVIAVDNKIGPLSQAIKNIKEANLENNIIPVLSDGLKDVIDDYDIITISGMGGELIVNILKEKDLKNKTLILEPNNNQKLVREYLESINFKIIDEKIVKDHGVYYQIIKASYNDINKIEYNDYELLYGPINLIKKPIELKELINKQIDILKKAMETAKDKMDLKEKIDYLEGVLIKYEI